MKDEKYWYQEWKNAAERSTFSEIYPQADLCWDHAASTYDLGMGNSLERVDVVLEELKKMAGKDPVRTIVVDMTKLNLVEITRKKVKKPLHEWMGNR